MGIEISSSGSERDVISEGSHWSSIRPPSRLHGCRRTASPALSSLVDVSGEYKFVSRETPEGSLTSSRSVAIEVPWSRNLESHEAISACWRSIMRRAAPEIPGTGIC